MNQPLIASGVIASQGNMMATGDFQARRLVENGILIYLGFEFKTETVKMSIVNQSATILFSNHPPCPVIYRSERL